jgi:hypothetical protein
MSQHLPDRTGPIRIGDTERDRAVAVLSDHFVAGRLTQEEFEERSNQATRARYDADLAPLFADLPDPAASQPRPQMWSPGFRPGPPPFLWLIPVLMVGLVVGTVSLAAPWILWVLFWIAMFGGPYNHRRWHHPRR